MSRYRYLTILPRRERPQHRHVAYWSSKHLSISPVCNFIMSLLNNGCKYGLTSTLLGDERCNYEHEWHRHTQMEGHPRHAICRINKLIGLFESLRYSNWRDRDCERFAFSLTLLRLMHREFLPVRNPVIDATIVADNTDLTERHEGNSRNSLMGERWYPILTMWNAELERAVRSLECWNFV